MFKNLKIGTAYTQDLNPLNVVDKLKEEGYNPICVNMSRNTIIFGKMVGGEA